MKMYSFIHIHTFSSLLKSGLSVCLLTNNDPKFIPIIKTDNSTGTLRQTHTCCNKVCGQAVAPFLRQPGRSSVCSLTASCVMLE